MNVSFWCSRIIRYSFYLLCILVPLVLTPWNYELFEYNKMMVTYFAAAVIGGAWAVKMLADGEIRVTRTPLDIPIALFALSQFVSALFSIDPHVSWFGYYSRFNGGMFSIITYIVLYYAFVTNFDVFADQEAHKRPLPEHAAQGQTKKHTGLKQTPAGVRIPSSVITFLKVLLSSATVVAAYGVAEHYGIDRQLWVQDVQSRVFSTLGQPNWLAAFLTALIPVSMMFTLANPPFAKTGSAGFFSIVKHVVWSLITLLLFIVLLYTRSRSGLAGLAVADILFWTLLLTAAPREKHYVPAMVLLHAAFAVVIFFNGSNIVQIDKYFSLKGIQDARAERAAKQTAARATAPPAYTAPLLEVGGTESGTIRKYVWAGAVSAWKSTTKTLLIGTGTETFAFAFYRFRPAGHNMTSEWDFLYNKAHNEYLNYLATTGLFGLGSYVVWIGTFVIWFVIRAFKNRSLHQDAARRGEADFSAMSIALFAGWVSILVTNFFGFSVVIMQLFLFLFPALTFALHHADRTSPSTSFALRLRAPSWLTAAVIVLAVVTASRIVLFWYADILYASAYRQSRSGQYAAAKLADEQAIMINPGEPNYHDEYASTLAAFAGAAYEQQNATMAAEFAKKALAENDRAISISPQNVGYWKTRTKLYYTFSAFNPELATNAIEALARAGELSPNDPKIYYNLAILHGRVNKNEDALKLLRKAISLKPNYHDAYYALYVFYTEMKNPAAARATLEEYLKNVDAQDKQFTQLLEGKSP